FKLVTVFFSSLFFSVTFSIANQPRNLKIFYTSSAVFQVEGNVYPFEYVIRHYTVSLSISYPSKLYDFDLDFGSDLTWVQCDAPCKGCTKPSDQLYKSKNNLVQRDEELCAEFTHQMSINVLFCRTNASIRL
ncbi:hypothetical protein S83_029523, partial [Arachis hypogaea]